jgi:hypothetical protein
VSNNNDNYEYDKTNDGIDLIEIHFNININVNAHDVKNVLRINRGYITGYDDTLYYMRYNNHFINVKSFTTI